MLEYWVQNFTMQADESRKLALEKEDESLRRPKRIISIAIVDFIMFPELKDAHTVHKICNMKNGKASTDLLELHVLELPKAVETIKNENLALWSIFFGSKNFEEDKLMLAEKNTALKKAVNDYDFFREDRDFVSEYEKHEIYLTGIAMMKAEAISEGHAEGKIDSKNEIAMNLISMGLPIEQISQATGLSLKDLEKLSATN